jgi:hypothetical protein
VCFYLEVAPTVDIRVAVVIRPAASALTARSCGSNIDAMHTRATRHAQHVLDLDSEALL